MNRLERNDLIHGIAGWDSGVLFLNRRKSDGRFSSKKVSYMPQDLLRLSLEFAQLTEALMGELEISDEHHREFLQAAHSAVAKESKSPSPPQSARSSRFSTSQS